MPMNEDAGLDEAYENFSIPDEPDMGERERVEDDEERSEPLEDMDGDHASALASAGFGTDEDYGDYGGGGDDW